MAAPSDLDPIIAQEYQHGFVTDIESESFPLGLNETILRRLSAIKQEPEFLLEWRLSAYRKFLTMTPPTWAHLKFPPIDLNALAYYSAQNL